MSELEKRIDALERAVTDGDHDLSELAAEGEATERLAAVEERLDELDDRVAELEAATQALRGYVGNVRSVNRDVERRADAALATAEKLESAVAGDTAARTNGAATQSETPTIGTTDTDTSTDGLGATATNSLGAASNSTGQTAADDTATNGTGGETDGTGQTVTATVAKQSTDESDCETKGHRCQACGRPTVGQSEENPAEETSAGHKRQNGTAGGALDGAFRASEEDDERGPFERIREML